MTPLPPAMSRSTSSRDSFFSRPSTPGNCPWGSPFRSRPWQTDAVLLVVRAPARGVGRLLGAVDGHHRQDPRHLVAVDVEQARSLRRRRRRPTRLRRRSPGRSPCPAARGHPLAVRAHLAEAPTRSAWAAGSTVVEVGLGEPLPGERRRQRRQRLRAARPARPSRSEGGAGLLLHRKERPARLALEEEDVARLGDLRDRVDLPSLSRSPRTSDGGGGQVAVPEIVVHELVVPDPLARGGLAGRARSSRTGSRRGGCRPRNRRPRCPWAGRPGRAPRPR